MTFAQIATLYVCAVPVFFAIDMLWLGFVAKSFYRSRLGDLLLTDFNWVAGFSFYFLYIVGILVFAVLPALEAGSLTRALVLGAFFGFIAYATYDLTNLATLRNWSLAVSLVDMAWGAVLTGSVSTLVYLIGRKLFF